ncbi:MAG: hypothetical protein KC421_30190, partial [Anaerolineales bacterium]|nr:hypothetical protein [Anaerolineales bacterium]
TLGLCGMWAWYGSRIVRLGLLWTALHLAFIYAALWTQKPELYAGRHLYQAMPGIAIAIGASVKGIRHQVSSVRYQSSLLSPQSSLLLLFGLAAAGTLVYQGVITRSVQGVWLADVTEDQSIRPTMRAIMPEVDNDTHIFANRLPITPKFLRSVVYVWYGIMPPNPSGELSKLLADGMATQDYFVFDYENGRLFNLMPELQQHDETHLLLAQPITHDLHTDGEIVPVSAEVSAIAVEGPKTARRLSLRMNPRSDAAIWASQSYLLTIPANSTLAFGVLPVDGMAYRVLLEQPDGTAHTLWEA